MRLPHAARSNEEERIVAVTGLGDHRVCRAYRHLIGRALLVRAARERGLRPTGRNRTRERVLDERHRLGETLRIAEPLVPAKLRIHGGDLPLQLTQLLDGLAVSSEQRLVVRWRRGFGHEPLESRRAIASPPQKAIASPTRTRHGSSCAA